MPTGCVPKNLRLAYAKEVIMIANRFSFPGNLFIWANPSFSGEAEFLYGKL